MPGIDLVMAATGFDEALAGSDIVITGEGRIDDQTAFGKTAMGVARRAQAAGVRCLAIGGSVTSEGREALAAVLAEAVAVHEAPITLDLAIAAGVEPIAVCAGRLASRLT
jgi:glycerate kinase